MIQVHPVQVRQPKDCLQASSSSSISAFAVDVCYHVLDVDLLVARMSLKAYLAGFVCTVRCRAPGETSRVDLDWSTTISPNNYKILY